MTHDFDMAASLAAGVRDRAGAWEFIRGFAAHWTADALRGASGWSEDDLAQAEARLGLRLPAALREAYLLLGRRGDLTGNHDVLLGPDRLHVDDAGQALVFRHENQGAASWGVLLGGPPDDDPPVAVRADLADKAAERWEPWLGSVSLAFVEIVLSESVQDDGPLCDYLDDPGGDGLDALERHCVRLPFPSYPVGEEEDGIRWFLGPEVLLRDDGGTSLLARGRTEQALERIRGLIPGDWLEGDG